MQHPDLAALNQWYPIETESLIPQGLSRNCLMETPLTVERSGETITIHAEEQAEPLPVLAKYGLIWTSLGTPEKDLFDIPEVTEPDRRWVPCGSVSVRASGLRLIENFLDLAHLPFVHTEILGAEPHTEIRHYTVEIRRDVDEVWATNCEIFQPQAALKAKDGIIAQYIYRVMTPFTTMLYKSSPGTDNRWDVICLFVQPLGPDRARAHPVMYLLDERSSSAQLIEFQQLIFLQDRIILENQRPTLLPMEPRAEIPTRADATSVAYRRWLKDKGITYGTVYAA